MLEERNCAVLDRYLGLCELHGRNLGPLEALCMYGTRALTDGHPVWRTVYLMLRAGSYVSCFVFVYQC